MRSARPSEPARLTEHEAELRSLRATTVFTPATPISARELFAGRIQQIERTVDAINQPGQHAVLYGDRGVGKTSLANILGSILPTITPDCVTVKVNCDSSNTFIDAWRKAFDVLAITSEERLAGFHQRTRAHDGTLAAYVPASDAVPHDIFVALRTLGVPTVFIFDEFDRLGRRERRWFTDFLKTLSDTATPTTVILVGVADTVDELIEDHASIERALAQVFMPRMDESELGEILSKGQNELGMTFDARVAHRVVRLSQGLPHYTHLLGLHSTRAALRQRRTLITMEDFAEGLRKALADAEQSIRSRYIAAVESARKDALYAEVLLAAALAETDPHGYFRPSDLAGHLKRILGRDMPVSNYTKHLNEFCEPSRGPVLLRTGSKHRHRYRFKHPLLRSFVIMASIDKNLISSDVLDA